jgi:hypothetical protein
VEDLADIAADAAGELSEVTLEAAAAGIGVGPWFYQRWVWLILGLAAGGHLLLGDGAVTGTASDIWGAGLIIGSPILLFLLPWWWNNI